MELGEKLSAVRCQLSGKAITINAYG